MRLSNQLILAFALMLAVSLAINSYISTLHTRRALIDEAADKAAAIVDVLEASDRFVRSVPAKAEELIGAQMLVEASLLAHLVDIAENRAGMSAAEIRTRLKQIVAQSPADEFWITDEKGHAYLRNIEAIDFTFPEKPTPKDQAYRFRSLLDQRDGHYVQPIIPREVDGRVFKYAGVSGVDKPRIVQVGYQADSLVALTSGMSRTGLLASLVGKGGVLRFQVLDSQGRVQLDVSDSKITAEGTRRGDEEAKAALRNASASKGAVPRLAGNHLTVAQAFASGQDNHILLVTFDARHVRFAMQRIMRDSGLTALGILLLATLFALRASRVITGPITALTTAAQSIAQGDIVGARRTLQQLVKTPASEPAGGRIEIQDSSPRSETQRLLSAIVTMTENLNSLASRVQMSGAQVMSASKEIGAGARELESATATQAASIVEVHATAREISATSRELAGTVSKVAQTAEETTQFAADSQKGLGQIERAMDSLMTGLKSISGRLSTITSKTMRINSMVIAMAKVSEQTNLLSLNAAIEAEKAGEQGKGFSVVAREIRRLADQTAVSALDIKNIVKEMQAAVTTGVSEMDAFQREAEQASHQIVLASGRLGEVIERVQALTPLFESVNSGMHGQSIGASQIEETMAHVGGTAQQTAHALKEFNGVAIRLNEAAQGLEHEVLKFRVAADLGPQPRS